MDSTDQGPSRLAGLALALMFVFPAVGMVIHWTKGQ